MVKTTAQIQGMMCRMCEAKVREALEKGLPDAKKIVVSYRKGTAVVYRSEPVPLTLLQELLASSGYEVMASTEEEDSGRHFIFW